MYLFSIIFKHCVFCLFLIHYWSCLPPGPVLFPSKCRNMQDYNKNVAVVEQYVVNSRKLTRATESRVDLVPLGFHHYEFMMERHFNLTKSTKSSLNIKCVKRKTKSSKNLTHYSKSQIFVQKFNFDKTPTFSRVFHPNFF